MGRIVVGVDGSEESSRALRWAVEEARLRGASVDAVHVYEHTPSWQVYAYTEGVPPMDAELFEGSPQDHERAMSEQARALVAGMIEALGDVSPVTVTPVAIEDRRPVDGLIEQSEDAELLVVGSRRRGALADLILGSVSHQCATHARCPVVVIGPGGQRT